MNTTLQQELVLMADTVNQRRAALGLNTLEKRLQEMCEQERLVRVIRDSALPIPLWDNQ